MERAVMMHSFSQNSTHYRLSAEWNFVCARCHETNLLKWVGQTPITNKENNTVSRSDANTALSTKMIEYKRRNFCLNCDELIDPSHLKLSTGNVRRAGECKACLLPIQSKNANKAKLGYDPTTLKPQMWVGRRFPVLRHEWQQGSISGYFRQYSEAAILWAAAPFCQDHYRKYKHLITLASDLTIRTDLNLLSEFEQDGQGKLFL